MTCPGVESSIDTVNSRRINSGGDGSSRFCAQFTSFPALFPSIRFPILKPRYSLECLSNRNETGPFFPPIPVGQSPCFPRESAPIFDLTRKCLHHSLTRESIRDTINRAVSDMEGAI
jgi:hypothetical protein